jgi:translation initiation factor IF-1
MASGCSEVTVVWAQPNESSRVTLVNGHGVAAHNCEGVRKVLYIQCK